MNNLLRTLTEANVKPQTDLRLLLTTVREGRKQSVDTKLSDPFYDALEGLLLDLKTITLDNRDAEAFLKPVSKAEVPDYYDVIANPMDFQTMLKKVKQKQYKSKREFKDDLELIWSNCYTYNASENHPLRQCVKRLKAKGDRLLKHITDRRERTDPIIPPELGAGYTGVHPRINGASRTHTRSPSYSSTRGGTPGVATVKLPLSLSRQPIFRSNASFPDGPAITRTPEGMAMFYELDREVATALKKPSLEVLQKLRELVPAPLVDGEVREDLGMLTPEEDDAIEVDGVVGDKRKLQSPNDHRPRKRARFVTPYPAPLSSDQTKDEISELWWAAAQSDTLLANGVPPIPFGPASSEHKARCPSSLSSSTLSLSPFHSQSTSTSIPKAPKLKSKRRKKQDAAHIEVDEVPPTHIDNPKALLNMMNVNVKTMRRVRHTHGKFAALNATTLASDETEEGATGPGAAGGSGSGNAAAGPSNAGAFGDGSAVALNAAAEDEILNEKIDERPWVMMVEGKGKGKGKGKERLARVGGIEVGEKNAWGCLQWSNQKILEHAGFQGTSQAAMDLLAGVMSEYLSNVGRTIKYMCDTYSATMTPEEIILHTLFESGNSKIQDLERYIRDDVERYSSRLNDLEKKIIGAYRETTAGETLEDEGLFEDEDEEETGALAVGDFADLLGEDYLGLRELGIAQEFGMSSLSIPKKLLKSKKNQLKPAAAKPSEPPPPYPPPPPFVLLSSSKLDDQIGLLKPFYASRFTTIAATAAPPPPPAPIPLPGPSLPGPSIGAAATLPGPTLTMPSLPGPTLPQPPPPPQPPAPAPVANTGLPSANSIMVPRASQPGQPPQQQQPQSIDLASLPALNLPDDAPSAVQAKMGPLGQITKGGGASGAGKKKSKGAASGGSGAGSGSGAGGAAAAGAGGSIANGVVGGAGASGGATPGAAPAGSVDGASPKKKKGATGMGNGTGRKKKGPEGQGGSQNAGGGGTQGQGSPYPPVVVASA
ncbi:hypothetical protein P691DRAFT_808180 [Macrolepiota fuliginosa MF-IS2]|uniref:Bromo domain-containing protein n=1 Tax=Macrolepiota fuliginosa MF-IS2 TaxID=1400762 RepID=A0A9P6BZR8_9AGAR|nr:hypothetical protein P691DRAFT_808180 [Macrolepiota fuliginosa MF-IS2]